MLTIKKLSEIDGAVYERLTKRSGQIMDDIKTQVNGIVAEVRENGDRALRQYTRQFSIIAVADWTDLVPVKGVVKCAFPNFFSVKDCWELHIRHNTSMLCTFTGDAIKLAFSNFQLPFSERNERLHRTFTKRAISYNNTAFIVLYGARKNFGGGGG